MPFRDAGYSQADYGITVQDVVYGVWKAKDHGCCDLDSFNLAEYEMYERVENGDFNWITPYFVAFASPSSQPVERVVDPVAFAAMPRTEQAIDACEGLNDAFRAVLKHFAQKKVGLVVRLNDQLYSPSYFEALGIRHLDMIFEDGTCPSLAIVRKFIKLANEMISVRKRGIAVHCKAGLGRTGCLIGAYLIYKHGFTANEVIAYMRFMRPGMVVGPQQHWLHINQDVFRQWRLEDKIERRLRKEMAAAMALPSTPVRAMQKTSLSRTASGQSVTTTPPPASSSQQMRSVSGRSPLSEMDNEQRTTGGVVSQDDYLPAPTPGQPRKTARHHPYSRSPSHTQASATANTGATSTSEDAAQQHQRHQQSAEVDEEWVMRMRARRRGSGSITSPDRGSQRSSGGGVSGRSSGSVDNLDSSSSTMTTVYEQTTTTTTTVTSNLDMVSAIIDNDASLDAENIGSSPVTRAKTAAIDHNQPTASPTGRSSAGSAGYGGIVVNKVRGSARATTSTRGVGTGAAAAGHHQSGAGVRKTSGRVGSIGSTTAAAVAVAAAVGREAKRVHAA